jgi:DNA mismatch repair protein MutH
MDLDRPIIKLNEIKDDATLLAKAKWLEGKTLREIADAITTTDEASRVLTKGDVGYVIEKGFFGIEKNSDANPDIEHLGIEIKTCPLKYNSDRTKLSVKEPLSLNIINYMEEHKNKDIMQASWYKKNKKVLFIFYIHDKNKPRSEYLIKYVFLWKIDQSVIDELKEDYEIILSKIREGKAHEIHQSQNKFLTLCPKHNGTFKDPNCHHSKRPQPFSSLPAEIRAFRLKNKYVNLIVTRAIGKKFEKGGWAV